jgi:hypothetical protein
MPVAAQYYSRWLHESTQKRLKILCTGKRFTLGNDIGVRHCGRSTRLSYHCILRRWHGCEYIFNTIAGYCCGIASNREWDAEPTGC